MLPGYEVNQSFIETAKAAPKAHRDKHVQYSHEMPDDTAEASARALIRAVPLVYGALFGGLIGNLVVGVSLGFALSMALDSKMGPDSLSRPLLRPLFSIVCPAVVAIVHGLAGAMRSIGVTVPDAWSRMRCRGSKR